MIDPGLRLAADARARSPHLAAQLIAWLPKRPSLALLGAASWPLLCWLAPQIRRSQVWRMVDADDVAIDAAFERIAWWADDQGLTVTWPKRAMLVHLPGGAWRVEGVVGDVSEPHGLDLRYADAVVADGLLAGRSAAWLGGLVNTIGGALLATLTQIGPASVLPLSSAIRAPRGADERNGARAIACLTALLRSRGDVVSLERSTWRARGDELALQRAWIDDAVLAGRLRASAAAARGDEWAALRGHQMMRGRLRIRVPCCDVLALPVR